MSPEGRRVAVLGATGAVGQRLISLLADHPLLEVVAVTASERSAGRSYADAVSWLLGPAPPTTVAGLEVRPTTPDGIDASLVLSALDSATARVAEPAFRDAGCMVVSNASAFRQDPEVPLVIPEVNPDHLDLVAGQRRRHGGAIVTNPNCSTIGLCLSLAPLRPFGLERVMVTTLQAASGAGYPGVASLDLIDNVLPEIAGEEDKLGREPARIFGSLDGGHIAEHPVAVSAQCNRVAVRDGHLLSVAVELGQDPNLDQVRAAFAAFRSPLSTLTLPSAPERPVVLVDDFARPQPALDRERSGGMTVTVGRLEPCPVLGLRYVAVVHNTVRGAAGGTLLLAELLAARGLV